MLFVTYGLITREEFLCLVHNMIKWRHNLYFNIMNIWLAYFLSQSRKSLSYSHNVLPEKAFRSATSLVQKKMAVLGGKKTYVVGFLFCGTLKKRLAQRVRNVCTSDIDVLFVYIRMLRIRSIQNTIGANKYFIFSAKGAPAPLIALV